jgi:hypothetical protein
MKLVEVVGPLLEIKGKLEWAKERAKALRGEMVKRGHVECGGFPSEGLIDGIDECVEATAELIKDTSKNAEEHCDECDENIPVEDWDDHVENH